MNRTPSPRRLLGFPFATRALLLAALGILEGCGATGDSGAEVEPGVRDTRQAATNGVAGVAACGGALCVGTAPGFGNAITSVRVVADPGYNFVNNGPVNGPAGLSVQVSYQLNGALECNNPTQGGNQADNAWIGQTSSVLMYSAQSAGAFVTVQNPGFWVTANQRAPANDRCGWGRVSGYSRDTVQANVNVGMSQSPVWPNVIQHVTTWTPRKAYAKVGMSAPTFFMPQDYSYVWQYDIQNNRLIQVNAGQINPTAVSSLPVVMWNGTYAVGLVVAPQPGYTVIWGARVAAGTKMATSMLQASFEIGGVQADVPRQYAAYYVVGDLGTVVGQMYSIARVTGY